MSSAAAFWGTSMSAPAWKRQRTGRSRSQAAPGGFARSMAYGQPSYRRVVRFRGRMSGRYGRRYGAKGSATGRETGYVDLASASYNFDTTGSVTLIAVVAQGASVNQRIGKKISWKSTQFRGLVQANTATTVTDGALLIIYDRFPAGALPAVTDILVTADSRAFNNDVNSSRFRVLKRTDFVVIGNVTAPSTGGESISADFYLDLKGLKGQFKAAATGAIGDIAQGALYLVTVGNSVAGNTASTLIGGFRTRFNDAN